LNDDERPHVREVGRLAAPWKELHFPKAGEVLAVGALPAGTRRCESQASKARRGNSFASREASTHQLHSRFAVTLDNLSPAPLFRGRGAN
jgi:hypothetical protein